MPDITYSANGVHDTFSHIISSTSVDDNFSKSDHNGEPISSRTRTRTRTRARTGQCIPPTSDSSAVPGSASLDDSEDSDYIDTDSDSDTSMADSADEEDEPISPGEVTRLRDALSTWERIDLEDHVPLDIIRVRFPETRQPAPLVSPLDEEVCAQCGEPVHDDDWLDEWLRGLPDSEFLDDGWGGRYHSADYCLTCFRLKDDFNLRAGFCNCRCRCREVVEAANDLYGSDDEFDTHLYIPPRLPVPRRALLESEWASDRLYKIEHIRLRHGFCTATYSDSSDSGDGSASGGGSETPVEEHPSEEEHARRPTFHVRSMSLDGSDSESE